MTTSAADDHNDLPAPFVLKDPGIATSRTEKAGAEKTDRKDLIETKIRVAYTVPARGDGKFHPIKSHEAFLKELIKADPGLVIVPVLPAVNPYSNTTDMPKTETEFTRHFAQVEEKAAGLPRRIVICHSVRTSQSINDLKFRNAELLQYLRDNKIMLSVDKFKMRAIASVGFLFEIHPGLTNRDRLRFFLHDLLNQVEMDDDEIKELSNKHNTATETNEKTDEDDDDDASMSPKLIIPDFELLVSTVGFGNGKDRITTRAIDIHCAAEDALLLKELLVRCKLTDHEGSGRFIPRGLAQMASPTVYKNYMSKHNRFLNDITQVPIFGLTRAAANYLVATYDPSTETTLHTPVRAILEKSATVISLEPTNRTDDLGKWFLITTKSRLDAARTLVDTQFKELFNAHLPRNKPELRIPDFPYPRRPVRPSYSVGILSYAETLKQSVITQEDEVLSRPPPRPPKRAPITFIYDPNEFPAPPAKKKNNISPDKTSASANSSVTHANTTQTIEEVKESILTDIRAEVKKMITTEMGTILDQCKQLIQESLQSYQTQMQATISTVIATEIKNAFQNIGNPPSHNPPATSGQNLAETYTTHYGVAGSTYGSNYDQQMSDRTPPRQSGHNPTENYQHS